MLYGPTLTGGSSGNGTVFQINTDGTGYTVLRQFTNSPDGANPYAGMILSSNVLYGTTGGGGSAGCGTVFSLYGGPYPIVVSQPQNQIASVSNAVSFSVTAGWTAPFGYQWYFTNTTFQTAGAYAQALSGFVYGCLVTNGGYGYTTVPQVQFIGGGGTGAAGYAVVSNGLVTGITVTNTGSGYTSLPLVQIDSPNGLLVNKTNVTLNVSAVTTNNVGFYFAVITNAYGSVTSSVASLNLSASIVNQPQSLMVLAGNSAAFAVTGDNTGPFTYQWQFGGTKIIGATNASYTVNPVATNNAGTYTVAVSNIYGGIISSGALLTVSYISQPPASQSVTNGGTANFNVGVTGSGSFTYQWQFNGTNLQSATQSTLSLTNVAAGNAGNYAVVITAASGSVTSSPAVLNILYPPSILQQPQRMTVAQGNNATSGITAGGTAPFGYQWWMISGTQSNATAVPVVINGFVLGANMTSGGAGYLAVPTVQFVGGSGSSAGGNAVVSNRMVTTIIITNTGSGYTTPPTIQIGAPSAIALTGQTNATLTLVSVTNGNAANYFVVVTNNYGSITSSIASLIVAPVGYNQISTPVLSNGKMSLSFVGVQGTNYALDRSFTLSPANWIPQVTNPADANGNLIFTNAPDPTTNNFWRIRSVP